METPTGRRVIEVRERVVGPTEPRLKSVRPRKLSDYPHMPSVYHDVARQLSSPMRMGPPVCDELMALVQHLFSEEEAGVVRHLGLLRGRRAADIARAEHRTVEQVEPILDRLSNEKRVVLCGGPPEDRRREFSGIRGIPVTGPRDAAVCVRGTASCEGSPDCFPRTIGPGWRRPGSRCR